MSFVHKDYEGAKIGMWLFLFTELILFSGLFITYAYYRAMFPVEFHHAAAHLDTLVGTANTVILLTSSLTMVLSITALQRGGRKLPVFYIIITNLCALAFMVNKFFEWSHKFHVDLYPGSETMLGLPNGEIIFYGLYYMMTGLHGFHVLIGMVLLTVIAIWVWQEKITKDDFVKLENSGLYWHLVDLIWIFLFPLFYLIT